MHLGKLNLLHPISDSSGSSASVFNISGVMSEGPEGVVSRRRSNSVIYFPNEMGSDLLGIEPVMEANFEGNYFCLLLVQVIAVLCLE